MKRFWTTAALWAAFVCGATAAFSTVDDVRADESATETAATRWNLETDGSIVWSDFSPRRVPHNDHIEASGERVSTVFRYGVDEKGAFRLNRSVVWPMLRTIPNNTHASLTIRFDYDLPSRLTLDGKPLANEKTLRVALNGFLSVVSRFDADGKPVEIERRFFPSTTGPFVCERATVKNIGTETVVLSVPELRDVDQTDPKRGVNGAYTTVAAIGNPGESTLKPGESATVNFAIQAFSEGKGEREATIDFAAEEAARAAFVSEIWSKLVLETPEPILNAAFAFAKIRASESIYRTAGGLMHGPGGESYYAAIWANDQAEYVNPFFPYLGYAKGNESALNSFRHFARFMNDKFRPIPSSIIAEGIDIWNGAGDRGDAAMIAYGAARYALVRGDEAEARELWPLIAWCLEYCNRKLTADGVVASDCDELERRFPAGDANLCTSVLFYDALLSAAALGRELGEPKETTDRLVETAASLRECVEKHFGRNVRGFETYQYYDGCEKLRSWICVPFIAGIDERAEGTIAALFSDRLWTKDGLLTEEGSKTFWDRSTLYALRGVLAVGATEKGLDKLRYYSATRLLGEHVPYPIEAWPEGSQRHLSAESGLYCRIYVEGLFGMRPTGFRSFDVTPRLPEGWDHMALRGVCGFGSEFDLTVDRADLGKLRVSVIRGTETYTTTINEGETWNFKF
ncbi:MAG: hypothetical protein J6K20_08280 [Thermoguttaceae bacterium]|nr:hypothetical protein [Thermoguttaceae bacterium]